MRGGLWLLGGCLWAVASCHKAPPPSPPAPAPASPQTVFVVLVFPGEDLRLHREIRELPELPPTAEAQAKAILQELFGGPREALAPVAWWPVEVKEVFHDGKGTFFVDLSSGPPSTAGSEAELALQSAVATTLAINIREVKRVQLLFGGKELTTLGHLDFSRPSSPRWDLLAP